MAANLAELDPLFVRALRLLHSKSKESEVQLKALLDESIRQRKAGLPVNIPTPPLQQGSNKDHRSGSHHRGGENEKNLDRLKKDLSQMVPGGVANKKPRLEVVGTTTSASSGSGRLSSSMTPSPTASAHLEEPDEMDMDLDFQGLTDCTCCICKSFNQENGNKLMECHTCQNLYHQECHEPVITDQEVADPRLIWNCSKCVKPIAQSIPASQNKSTKQPPVINKIPSTAGGGTSRSGGGGSSSTTSSNSGSGKGAMGMAGLASSFSSTSSSSSKSSSSGSNKKLRRFQ